MKENNSINIQEYISELKKKDIKLFVKDGKLKFKAPKDIITQKELGTLKGYREVIIQYLKNSLEICAEINRKDRYEPFPLTDVQTSYLLGRGNIFDYGNTACHIYLELTYSHLEQERVELVWNQLVRRHDMLHAVIYEDGSQQVVKDILQNTIIYDNLSKCDENQFNENIEKKRREFECSSYEIGKVPFFKVGLTNFEDKSYLHLSIEFIIADWTSILILISEFEKLYFEPDAKVDDFEIQFRDYILAERKLKESNNYFRDREYWMNRIERLPLQPELPILKKSKSEGAFRRFSLILPNEKWNKLKENARKAGVTPTIVVMTVYAAVLAKWSQNKDFCINLTVLNRLPLHEDINKVIGDFTTVSLLEVNFGGKKSFKESATTINSQLFSDLDHRLFSGIEVLRELTKLHGKNAVIMPYVFTSSIGLMNTIGMNSLKGKVESTTISQTPQVLIECKAMDEDFGLQISWDIRLGIFPEGMVEDMFSVFENKIQGLAIDANEWETDCNISLPEWQQELLDSVNSTEEKCEYGLIHEKIISVAKNYPDKIAVVDQSQSLTYDELIKKAGAVVNELKKRGYGRGNNIVVAMKKSATQVAAIIGVLMAGAAYVTADIYQAEERRNTIISRVNAPVVLTAGTESIRLPENVQEINVDMLNQAETIVDYEHIDSNENAYMIFTSGSTGVPKGVVISHQAAVNTLEDIIRKFNITKDDKVLGISELSFDLSVFDIFGILSVGGILVYPLQERKKDPSHWCELLNREKITVWNSVPALLQMLEIYLRGLKETEKVYIGSLRLALLSGDWIPVDLPIDIVKYIPNAEIISLGGATEASIWSICHRCTNSDKLLRSIPYGKPLANQGFKVVDCNLENCPVHVPGELYITGVGLATEYYNDEKITAEHFIYHPITKERMYKTGDRGMYLPNGEIEFLGRIDNQIKINGHRIELGEIEAIIKKDENVDMAAVIFNVKGEEKYLTAIIKLKINMKNGLKIILPDIKERLGEYLPHYMIPTKYYEIKDIPLTSNGKIDRKKIMSIVQEKIDNEYLEKNDVEMSELEKNVLDIWKGMGMESVNIEDDLFERGADSLIIAQFVSKIREKITNTISFEELMRKVLNSPSIKKLSDYIIEKMNLNDSENKLGEITLFGQGDKKQLRVLLHSVFGNLNIFKTLISDLVKQNSGQVAGISIKDIDEFLTLSPDKAMRILAADYAETILNIAYTHVQLIGYSYMGKLAIQVANELANRGIVVNDLVLIDSQMLSVDIKDEILSELLFIPNIGINIEQLGMKNTSEFFEIITTYCKKYGVIDKGFLNRIQDFKEENIKFVYKSLSMLSYERRVEKYLSIAEKNTDKKVSKEFFNSFYKVFRQVLKTLPYNIDQYKGGLRFIIANDSNTGSIGDIIEYWQSLCVNTVSTVITPGNHFNCIENDNLKHLIKIINEISA